MFIAHGYDAWVAPANKVGLGYRVTREIAAAALPSFLFLAGVGMAVRWLRTPATEHTVARRSLALRGLRLIAAGYALSLGYAALDGGLEQPAIWLRSDVLHAIGASMLVVVVLLFSARPGASNVEPGQHRSGDARWPILGAILLSFAIVMLWPPLRVYWSGARGVLGYALAPFLPVDGITRFAAVPLAVFCCLGFAFKLYCDTATVGRRFWASFALVGLGTALVGWSAVHVSLDDSAAAANFVLRMNVLDGAGRAVVVLALGGLLPARVQPPFALLGRHSLLLYAVHIPFCYGRFGKPLRSRLDLAQATFAMAALIAAALLLAAVLEAYSKRRAVQRSGR